MNDLFNTWQLYIVGYLVSVVIFFQYYKLAVKEAKNDGAATILLQVIAGLSILIFIPFFPIQFPTEIKFYIILSIASIFYALNDRLQVTARKHLEVSVFSILNMLKTFFLFVFGLLFFKENFIISKMLGALLILLGNGFLFYKKGKFKFDKYAIISIIATFIFAIAMSIDIGISKKFNLPIYISFTLLIPALILFLFGRQKFNDIVIEYNSVSKKHYFITGIFWGLTVLFTLRAYQLSSVTTIAPILATSVLLNVIVAYIFHKEKEHFIRKIVISALIFFGVYLTII
ncbi:MAG: EamA family transporter [Patescibacteria group bacterium]|jgi:drug/metabolite transporter (DMT)-like permease